MTVQIQRNTIEGLYGSWGSGLAMLQFNEGGGVHCENAATVRALDAATGAAIGPGHTINQDGIRDLEIVWFLDEFGLVLAGFMLYDDYLAEDWPELEPGVPYDLDPEAGTVEPV